MNDPFLMKVRNFGTPADDIECLAGSMGKGYEVTARGDICAPDKPSSLVYVLLDGWACKYRLLPDGRRQIIAFLLPGEICNLDRLIDTLPTIGVLALTDCKVANLNADWLTEARQTRPAIRDLLWFLLSREHSAMTEQLVALGRRTSRQRIAFLLCDLFERLQALGLAANDGFRSPLTQSDMADALGLSTVHVNRTLQGLREDGLIEMRGRNLRVPRPTALQRVANYARGIGNRTTTRSDLAFSSRSP